MTGRTSPLVKLLVVKGVILLALGGWLYYDSLPPPLCTFNYEEYELHDMQPDSEREVLFTLTNPTNDVVRIIALADC